MRKYKVAVIEFDGWRNISEEFHYFDTIDLAQHFIDDFNAKQEYDGDATFYARLEGLIEVVIQ